MRRKESMDVVFLEVMTSCTHCGARMPVNRPASSQTCSSCFSEVEIPAQTWSVVVNTLSTNLGRTGRGGFIQTTHQGQVQFLSFVQGRGGPPCATCNGETRVDSASGPQLSLRCGSCGSIGLVQPVPAWLKRFERNLAGMVTAPEQVQSNAPVVTVRCTSCGSGLEADGTRRSVSCAYCGTANLLADEVWQVFHPPRKMQRWWLLLPAPLRPSKEERSNAPAGMAVAATLFLGPFAVIFTVAGLLAVFGFAAAAGLFGALAGSFASVDEGIVGAFGFGVGAMGFGVGSILFLVMVAVGLIALAGLIAIYVKAYRMRRRESLLLESRQEVVGRLRCLSKPMRGKVKVEVVCNSPANPGVTAKTTATIDTPTWNRLGGEGASVRAWVDKKGSRCEVKWEPSPLLGD